jgi:8-oxo-dGTP pyrophosphatase MutT (NUDIX family)
MAIVTFYRGDPKNAPKPTMPAHLGANAIITCGGRLLLERRRDSDTWGLIGGGVKKSETTVQGMVREIYEELGIRVQPEQLQKLQTYGDPGRIAAFQDGSVWRMVIAVYGLDFSREPQMRISAESRELRFFTKEELKTTEIAVTHQDIVEDWFLNR